LTAFRSFTSTLEASESRFSVELFAFFSILISTLLPGSQGDLGLDVIPFNALNLKLGYSFQRGCLPLRSPLAGEVDFPSRLNWLREVWTPPGR